MRLSRRHILTLAGASFFAPSVASRARAQASPSRPVRVIAPVAAGGANDTTARLFAHKLSESLAQQFYVENIAGAGGYLGIGTAARAASTPKSRTILRRTSRRRITQLTRARLRQAGIDHEVANRGR